MAAGYMGGALEFDGTGDYVEMTPVVQHPVILARHPVVQAIMTDGHDSR